MLKYKLIVMKYTLIVMMRMMILSVYLPTRSVRALGGLTAGYCRITAQGIIIVYRAGGKPTRAYEHRISTSARVHAPDVRGSIVEEHFMLPGIS